MYLVVIIATFQVNPKTKQSFQTIKHDTLLSLSTSTVKYKQTSFFSFFAYHHYILPILFLQSSLSTVFFSPPFLQNINSTLLLLLLNFFPSFFISSNYPTNKQTFTSTFSSSMAPPSSSSITPSLPPPSHLFTPIHEGNESEETDERHRFGSSSTPSTVASSSVGTISDVTITHHHPHTPLHEPGKKPGPKKARNQQSGSVSCTNCRPNTREKTSVVVFPLDNNPTTLSPPRQLPQRSLQVPYRRNFSSDSKTVAISGAGIFIGVG
ncbi:Helicase SWR1 [Bienertia sinuspersici]